MVQEIISTREPEKESKLIREVMCVAAEQEKSLMKYYTYKTFGKSFE